MKCKERADKVFLFIEEHEKKMGKKDYAGWWVLKSNGDIIYRDKEKIGNINGLETESR